MVSLPLDRPLARKLLRRCPRLLRPLPRLRGRDREGEAACSCACGFPLPTRLRRSGLRQGRPSPAPVRRSPKAKAEARGGSERDYFFAALIGSLMDGKVENSTL